MGLRIVQGQLPILSSFLLDPNLIPLSMRSLVLGSIRLFHHSRYASISDPHPYSLIALTSLTISFVPRPHNNPTNGPLRNRLALLCHPPPPNGSRPSSKPSNPSLPRPENVRLQQNALHSLGLLPSNLHLPTRYPARGPPRRWREMGLRHVTVRSQTRRSSLESSPASKALNNHLQFRRQRRKHIRS